MLPVVVVDAGFALVFLGLLSLVKPLRFLGIASRPGGGLVLLAGLLAVAVGMAWPARETRSAAPGFALAAMNFELEDDGPGACRVTTETRVHATDARSRRLFATYWRTIYPGSALIRRLWLRAVRLRAEGRGGEEHR